ncbi:MAG: cbb3-type cytochrome c oxidase subunit 3 [Burkholderiales bacterium]|nr:cbb3-type cytochrome c oxidase subunit 3 [Burkholderiales bacterium]
MNPVWGLLAGIFIVLMMLAFIGVWVWSWLPRHKRDFTAMACLPLEDEDCARAGDVVRRDAR